MKKILIVEDDPSVKKLLEITFKEYGFDFISCESKKSDLLPLIKTKNIKDSQLK